MADYANYEFIEGSSLPSFLEAKWKDLLTDLRNRGYRHFHVLHKWMTVAPTDTEAEIRTGYTNLFDGVATPVALSMDSSDNTQDKATGTGALTAKVLATESTNHRMAEETFTLNGTTVVDGTTLFEHFNDATVVTYGSDGEPTGTVQVINHGDTEQYGQIANTGHCTINARTYIGEGYAGYVVLDATAKYNGLVTTATGYAITEGAQVRWKFVTLDANEPQDLAIAPIAIGIGDGKVDITPPYQERSGGSDEYVTLLADIVDEDVNGLLTLDWYILAWWA